MKMMRKQSGFTLIELMIVVAILAILMAIALPAYQDYTIRAQVSEGMNLTAGARTAMAEFWTDKGTWPANNTSAGLEAPNKIKGEYVNDVDVSTAAGKITATFNSTNAHKNIQSETLILSAIDNDGSISWACNSSSVDPKYLPARCR